MNTDNKIDIEKCFEQLEKASLYESNENTHSKILAYFFKTKQDFLKRCGEGCSLNISCPIFWCFPSPCC